MSMDTETAGYFHLGYTEEMVDEVAAMIAAAHPGWNLVCVWDYYDEHGTGGSSELYLERDGVVHVVSIALWEWLTDSEAGTPAPPAETWAGDRADEINLNDSGLQGRGANLYREDRR